jgi:peptidyl-prolyl cis-trans isomerase C
MARSPLCAACGLGVFLWALWGCGVAQGMAVGQAPELSDPPTGRLVLLPLQDRVGDPQAAESVQRALAAVLAEGWDLVPQDELRDAARRLRLRNPEADPPQALQRLGVELAAVHLISVTLHEAEWGPAPPPSVTVSMRVYRAREGALIWASHVSTCSLDRPRLLGLGAVRDFETLAGRAVADLVADLAGRLREAPRIAPDRERQPLLLALVPLGSAGQGEAGFGADAVTEAVRASLARHGVSQVPPGCVAEAMRRVGGEAWGLVEPAVASALRNGCGARLALTGGVETFEQEGTHHSPDPRLTLHLRLIDLASGRVVWMRDAERGGQDSRAPFQLRRVFTRGALADRVAEQLVAHLMASGLTEGLGQRAPEVAANFSSQEGPDEEGQLPAPAQPRATCPLQETEAPPEPRREPGRESHGQGRGRGQVFATVNGEELSLEDIEHRLARLHAEAGDSHRGPPELDRLATLLLHDVLLAQEARAMEMHLELPIVERVARRREELALRRLEREEISLPARPTSEEVRRLFEEDHRRVTLRVATAYDRAEAETLLAELEAGADFEALARERSVDPFAPRGGLLEDLPRYDLDQDVAPVAFGVEPGSLAGPIRTDLGWTVIRVEGFTEADPEDFAAVEPGLRDVVRYRKEQQIREELVREVQRRHPVTVIDEVVSAIVPERLPDGRLTPAVPDPDAVVARVGDREITAEIYGRALARRLTGVRNEVAAAAAAPMVLQRLIAQELLVAEALARCHGADPEVVGRLAAYERDLLVSRFLEEVVAAGIEVTEEEKQELYGEWRERLVKPPRLRLAQITATSLEEAERVAALAREGADFAWLARRHSVDGFREAGGDRGWSSPLPGRDPLNDQLAFAAPGDVLGPLGAAGHYVVLRVTAREEQGHYSFQEVSGNLRQRVYERKLQQAMDSYLERLRSRSEIEIDRELLGQLGVTGTLDEEEEP